MYMNFSKQFKMLRKKHKLTQKQVADCLNITQQNVSQYEKGIAMPKIECLEKIAELFGVEIGYLIDGERKGIYEILSQDEIEILEIYDSLSEEKKNISIELLKVLNCEKGTYKDEK